MSEAENLVETERAGSIEYRPFVSVKLTYIYMLDEDFFRYQASIDALGWQSTYFFNQCLSSFVGRNLEYFRERLATAADAMGIAPAELYEILRSEGEPEDLPAYVKPRPNYGDSLLANQIVVVATSDLKRRIGNFKASGRNVVGLRLLAFIERESTALTFSRVINWHYQNYWTHSYGPQMKNDILSQF